MSKYISDNQKRLTRQQSLTVKQRQLILSEKMDAYSRHLVLHHRYPVKYN